MMPRGRVGREVTAASPGASDMLSCSVDVCGFNLT